MEPAWDFIRTFRDRAGFHADKPLLFLRARNGIIANLPVVTNALEEFEKLQREILNSEGGTLPDLEIALDELLDELERADKHRYKRQQFKSYLMIPDTSGQAETEGSAASEPRD